MSVYDIPAYADQDYRGSEEIEGPGGFISLSTALQRSLDVLTVQARLAKTCESPIELQLGAKLSLMLSEPFSLKPQFWFGRFRMDFAVLRYADPCLFIECDGKKFHSEREQIENDLRKNAAAAEAKIPLLRFTGSDIYRHRDLCCAQVVNFLRGLA